MTDLIELPRLVWLAAGLAECEHLGLSRVLLTCTPDNEASRRVILANGGVPDD
jgi:predicted acetyltransferase